MATSLTVLAGAAILLALQSSLQTAETALEQSTAQGIADQLLDEVAHAVISFSSAALLRSFFKPSWTFRRAPSSEVPSASPTSR